ncbi:MAG: hypothetical protein KDG53_11485, partial [Rhodocyclaceae bacterium]|nr:hypothetical protein [Rhodocyclaceae bacterium]
MVGAVAEGVERQARIERLRAPGCDILQGCLSSGPLPPRNAEFMFLEARHRGPEQAIDSREPRDDPLSR